MTVLFSTHLAENQVPEGIFVQKERISMVSEDQEKAMVNTKHVMETQYIFIFF